MDTTDPDIVFDEKGVCSHCKSAMERLKRPPYGLSPIDKEEALNKLIQNIKERGKEQKYDCVIGLSGGVDSSYVAYLVKQWGLRPIAVHVDNGWDSEESTRNIENICRILNIDLYTNVLDWKEFKDLQLAFLKASTPDSDIPADNAIFETLYRVANEYGIKYILAGYNTSSESILAKAWSQGYFDQRYIKCLYRKFGEKRKLKKIKILSQYQISYYWKIKKMKLIVTLDYVSYDKEDAKRFLKEELNWQDYGRKHGESTFTRIFQEFILPRKFGYDKRRAHYSSLIVAGQLSRNEAIELLKEPLYTNEIDAINDILFFCDKFGISKDDFEKIMSLPAKSINDYPNDSKTFFYKLFNILRLARRFFRRKK